MYRSIEDRREKASRSDPPPGGPRYWITADHVAEFKRFCRRSARKRAKQDLRAGREPLPRYPVERIYFD